MFAVDPRLWSPIASEDAPSTETRLQQGLNVSYRSLFPLIFAAKPLSAEPPKPLPSSRPNVVLIVTESLRHDVFTPERMPRLFDWAQGGTVFENHYATAPYSETAMFSLIYGRSPLVFHSTLDARVPPALFAELRALGYECAFFTGHPKIWMRREEFLNESTLDEYVHDDVGSWPDWDKKALDRAVQLANAPARTKPIFALVLLMSTHFEYRYPPEYERHVPVANSMWPLTRISALGPEARTPHWNRYQNSVAFVDDLVADAVANLDVSRNVVIFTGDHGESVGDDGRFGHGYAF
jgi:membrane-anchored protein YejM (alkaline phosphatase superfamily)